MYRYIFIVFSLLTLPNAALGVDSNDEAYSFCTPFSEIVRSSAQQKIDGHTEKQIRDTAIQSVKKLNLSKSAKEEMVDFLDIALPEIFEYRPRPELAQRVQRDSCMKVFTQAHSENIDLDIFSDPSGDRLRRSESVECTFTPAAPDGKVIFFAPTSRGNLFSFVPTNRATFIYPRNDELDVNSYRAYKVGSVVVFVHKNQPVIHMEFNGHAYQGYCNKRISEYMSN